MTSQLDRQLTDTEAVTIALLEALTLMGQEHSNQTILLMLDRLKAFTREDILTSLAICERTCRRIYLADIIGNIPKKRKVAL